VTIAIPPHLEVALGMVGVDLWPTEDEDRLAECAAAYRACATALVDDVAPTAHSAVSEIAANNAGDHVDALTAFWAEYQSDGDDSGHLLGLATTLHVLADVHEIAAAIVKALKYLLIGLASMVAVAAAWAIASAAFTAGTAALYARSLIAGARIFARRFVAVLRQKTERFFGKMLGDRVEARIRRILDAEAPLTAAGRQPLRQANDYGDRVVYHGSPTRFSELQPRQPFWRFDGRLFKDGDPAICADENPDVPTFTALFKGRVDYKENGVDETTGGPYFYIRALKEAPEDIEGWVHVCKKKDFTVFDGAAPEGWPTPIVRVPELRAYHPVKPIEVFRVKLKDFPHPVTYDE
jgi:hypothetical protein